MHLAPLASAGATRQSPAGIGVPGAQFVRTPYKCCVWYLRSTVAGERAGRSVVGRLFRSVPFGHEPCIDIDILDIYDIHNIHDTHGTPHPSIKQLFKVLYNPLCYNHYLSIIKYSVLKYILKVKKCTLVNYISIRVHNIVCFCGVCRRAYTFYNSNVIYLTISSAIFNSKY